MKRMRFLLAISLVLCMLFTIVACQADTDETKEKTTDTEAENTDDKYAEEIDMEKWFRATEAQFIPGTIDFYIKTFKEKFNVNMKFSFFESAAIAEKLNVSFATNTYPDITGGMHDFEFVRRAVENNKLIPINDAIDSHPMWSQLPKDAFSAVTFDGNIYSFAVLGSPNGMYIRTDWLEKLNLNAPTNLDELTDVLHAFTFDDPDGNGEDDTYGYGFPVEYQFIDAITFMFLPTTPGEFYYDESDDSIKNAAYLKEDTLALLDWLRKTYDDGVLDPEFVSFTSKNDPGDRFTAGKYGMYMRGAIWMSVYGNKIKSTFPDSRVDLVGPMTGRYGSNMKGSNGGLDGEYVTDKCPDPERGIEILTWLHSKENALITAYGVEGEAYEISSDGTLKWLIEEAKALSNPGSIVGSIYYKLDPNFKLLAPDPPLEEGLAKVLPATETLDVAAVFVASLKSESYSDKKADLVKLTHEFYTKYIVGERTAADYDAYLEEFKSAGADIILEEMNAAN